MPWDQSRLGYTAKARWDRATKHVPVSKIKNKRTSLINLLLYFGFLLTPKPNRKLILNMFADCLLNQGSHILLKKVTEYLIILRYDKEKNGAMFAS